MYSPPCTLLGWSLCKNWVNLRYSIHTIYPQGVLRLLSPATSLFASNRQHQPSGLSRVDRSGERHSWTHILVSTIIYMTLVLVRRVLPTNDGAGDELSPGVRVDMSVSFPQSEIEAHISRFIPGKQEHQPPDKAFNPACVPATVQGKFQVLLRFHGFCMQVTEDLGNPN